MSLILDGTAGLFGNVTGGDISGNIIGLNGNSIPVTSTGSTTARSLANRFADVVNVKDFGAVGDWNGTTGTNNTTAFQNAMAAAAGKKLYIPSGRYLIQFTTNVCFTPPANIVIEGDGDLNTEIIVAPQGFTTSQVPVAFNLSNQGAEFYGIKIKAKVDTGNKLTLIGLSSSDVSINNCTLDGSVTNSIATLSNSVYGINHGGNSSSISNNFLIQNSKLTGFTFVFLKANDQTSISNNWKIIGNTFTGNYFDDCSLNSPNGIMNDVLISGNTLENNKTSSLGNSSLALGIALASITNATISDNYIKGIYYDAIHVEEKSDYVKIIGNSVSIDKGLGNSKCVSFNANNAGGPMIKPQHIVVSSNTFYQYGISKQVGTYGITFSYNQFTAEPADDIIVANNTFYNFGTGIYSVTTLNDSISINNNIIEQCGEGINVTDGALTIYNNTTKSCDFGITCNASTRTNEVAVIKEHVFIDCNQNVFVIDANNIVLINPKFIFSEFNHTPNTTLKTLLPARSQDRIYGQLTMTIISGLGFTTGSAFDIEVITWDGTSLTWNDTSSLTPSPTPVSRVNFENGFSLNASRTGTALDVAITNVTARDACRLQVDLTGAAMIKV